MGDEFDELRPMVANFMGGGEHLIPHNTSLQNRLLSSSLMRLCNNVSGVCIVPNKRKITQKKPLYGNNRPFSLKATRKHQDPNLQWKRIFVPKLGKTVRVKVSTKEMKTIDKIGLEKFLKRQGRTLESVVRES